MKRIRTSLPVALALLLLVPAAASAALNATRVRVAGHPGFVRAVVDLAGGTLTDNQVLLAPGSIDSSGQARLGITKAGATTSAPAVNSGGVRVSVVRTSGGLQVRVSTSAHRFKFLHYRVFSAPLRLVVDLYRRNSKVQLAAGNCLKINGTTSTSRKVVVRGRVVVQIFENNFRVRLRRSTGQVVSARNVLSPPGLWSAELRHQVATRQTGLVEAFVLSAKDGALQCLYQRPVTLRP